MQEALAKTRPQLRCQPQHDFKAHSLTAPADNNPCRTAPQWDAFISHAWEDKESFVRPLAHALTALGALVWYDEFSLNLGDSLSASIDRGLAGSRYGVVVLSKAFITKPWPQRELEGLVAREIDGRSTILPVWHKLTREDVLEFSPPLANKLAAKTADTTADQIALQILSEIRPDIAGNTPYEELRKIATGEAIAELEEEIDRLRHDSAELEEEIDRLRHDSKEFRCPHCGALLVESQEIPLDERQRDWGTLRSFDCGFTSLDGYKRRPCPSDPKFPKLEDYNIQCHESPKEPHWKWTCYALPKTDMARLYRSARGLVGLNKRRAKRWLGIIQKPQNTDRDLSKTHLVCKARLTQQLGRPDKKRIKR